MPYDTHLPGQPDSTTSGTRPPTRCHRANAAAVRDPARFRSDFWRMARSVVPHAGLEGFLQAGPVAVGATP